MIGSPTFIPTPMEFYADLIEYCNGVSTKNLLGIGASNKRSAFAMLLPRHFAKTEGVFDGLALGAVWGQLGIWSPCSIGGVRSLADDGWASLFFFSHVSPHLSPFISRVLSSYPAMSLCFVAGATGTMWGIKSKRSLPMFIAGVGVGMTLLADTRGIVWALPWLCGLLFVILFRGSKLSKVSRLLALAAPLYLSHQWAPSFYVFDAIGIEPQVDILTITLSLAENLPSTL